jgi:hypothetical protein
MLEIGRNRRREANQLGLRLALTGYVAIPRESEADFITEAAAAFIPKVPVKERKPKKAPTPIKSVLKKGQPDAMVSYHPAQAVGKPRASGPG